MTMAWILNMLLATTCMMVPAFFASRIARARGWPVRWVWAAAMGAAIALPTAAIWIPWYHPLGDLLLRIPGAAMVAAAIPLRATHWLGVSTTMQVMQVMQHSNTLAVSMGATVESAVRFACIALSVLGMAIFLAAHGWFRVQRARWPIAQMHGTSVCVAPALGPAVVGVFRPTVVLPAWILGAPDATQRMILDHEREHLAVGDSRLLTAAALLLALMPWNLMLWWHYRWLRDAIETDCDARILNRGADLRTYGEILLGVASRSLTVPLLSAGLGESVSAVERRIAAMTRRPGRPRRLRAIGWTGAMLASMVMVYDASSAGTVLAAAAQMAALTGFKLNVSGPITLKFDKDTARCVGVATTGSSSAVGHGLMSGTMRLGNRDFGPIDVPICMTLSDASIASIPLTTAKFTVNLSTPPPHASSP